MLPCGALFRTASFAEPLKLASSTAATFQMRLSCPLVMQPQPEQLQSAGLCWLVIGLRMC